MSDILAFMVSLFVYFLGMWQLLLTVWVLLALPVSDVTKHLLRRVTSRST
jgi:phage-related holin